MSERLKLGLNFEASLGDPSGSSVMLTPEEKAAAREVALGCTQNMLMNLDRDHRLAYVMDIALGMSSEEAAAVIGITPAHYRKRLSRARARLEAFTNKNCGLVNENASCHCHKQLPALRHESANATLRARGAHTLQLSEKIEAERQFEAMVRASDAIALIRAHPTYLAPESIVSAILSILRREGWWDDDIRTH
jgi:hypothetical protein